MNNPRFDYIGEKLPMLGFGMMRMPMLDEKTIDTEQVKKMVDRYMEQGMNYFDTAYMYHDGDSERTVKTAISSRYPREKFRLATKMPIWQVKEPADLEKIFAEQCEKTGVTYFDYYLLHSLGADHHKKVVEMGGYEFMKKLKADGRARHIGFSYHGDPDTLRVILTEHPEMEFIQLQLNYYDWEAINAKELFDISQEYGVPMILMEPVRGGMLAKLPSKAGEILKKARPDASYASWAMRYCGTLDGVMLVLSGMSSLEQMEDNLKTMGNFEPISPAEQELLDQVAKVLRDIPSVACTNCKYCVDCPQAIPIFDIFGMYNKFLENRNIGEFMRDYNKIDESSRASACIDCGLCSSVCPQHLEIPSLLSGVAELS